MKESEFISQNKQKWSDFEKIIGQKKKDPDELSDVFIQVTDDLSYTRTNYPNRSVRMYLNDLARKIFDSLVRRRKLDFSVIRKFYTIEVPQLMYLARREILISFVVFLLSMGIGIYSSIQNPDFASLVLGQNYVEMTKANIENGDAMAVYTGGSSMEGFLRIFLNNARIDVMMLGLGLFFSFGAIWILVRNGIMVGVFQYFFWQHGGFKDSLLTIWLHGTIEITTIGLMGGVALLAGKGLLFPGSYTRYQSFRLSAGNAGKLLLMVLPFTFIAALIEGFITRLTGMPDLIKAIFILASLALVVYYFFVYPRRVYHSVGANPEHETLRRSFEAPEPKLNVIRGAGQIISEAFTLYKKTFGRILFTVLFGAIAFTLIAQFGISNYHGSTLQPIVGRFLRMIDAAWGTQIVAVPVETSIIKMFKWIFQGVMMLLLFLICLKPMGVKLRTKRLPLYVLALGMIAVTTYLTHIYHVGFPKSLLISYLAFVALLFISTILYSSRFGFTNSEVLGIFVRRMNSGVMLWLGLGVILFFLQLLGYSGVAGFIYFALEDVLPFGVEVNQTIFEMLELGLEVTTGLLTVPVLIYSAHYFVASMFEKYEAISLTEELEQMKIVDETN